MSFNNHRNNFSLLHIVGAVMVIFGHCYPLLQVGKAPCFLGQPIHQLGVSLLFVISGYLSTLSLKRSDSVFVYYCKRLLRIYPPYAICILVTTGFLYFFSNTNNFILFVRESWNYIINNLLFRIWYLIPGVMEDNPYRGAINGSLWTLPFELCLYLLLPLFILPIGKWKKTYQTIWMGIVYLGFVIGTILLLIYYPNTRCIVWRNDLIWIIKLGSYFFGGAFYAFIEHKYIKSICRLESFLGIILLIVICWNNYQPWMTPVILPFLVVTIALNSSPWKSDFWNRYDIAYGLYLWSFPIQQALIQLLIVRKQFVLIPQILFLMTIILTGIIAYYQKMCIERLCSACSNKIISRMRNKNIFEV